QRSVLQKDHLPVPFPARLPERDQRLTPTENLPAQRENIQLHPAPRKRLRQKLAIIAHAIRRLILPPEQCHARERRLVVAHRNFSSSRIEMQPHLQPCSV